MFEVLFKYEYGGRDGPVESGYPLKISAEWGLINASQPPTRTPKWIGVQAGKPLACLRAHGLSHRGVGLHLSTPQRNHASASAGGYPCGYPPFYRSTIASWKGECFFKKKEKNGPPRPREAEATPSGGVPPDERLCTPVFRKESLPTSWYVQQFVRRNPSRQAGLCTSSPGGIPPDKLG